MLLFFEDYYLKIIDSISSIDIGLFRLFTISCMDFVFSVSKENGPFYLSYQIGGHRVVHSTSFYCPSDQ